MKPGKSADPELLRTVTDSMFRRGPDGAGYFTRGEVALGHRRLSVIDLSNAGAQPMWDSEKKIALVFNGEIYNFRELRRELEALGHRFQSQTDTEVILLGFKLWGVKVFSRLNGMFAFGLVDFRSEKPTLYLVRDRFGVKPLFYSRADGNLSFASELKPLMGLPWIRKVVDRESLFHFLKFSHIPGPKSILTDVEQLLPGTFAEFDGRNFKIEHYWSPLEISETPKREDFSEKDWLGKLDETLKSVVERQLVSDVPIGCFLSGGIDSSLLVSACAEIRLDPIDTFTIGYREQEFNEAPFAREVAKHFGTRHHEWIAEAKDFTRLIPEIPTYFDQPLADPTMLSSLLLSRFARGQVTVALSGDGGDELFFGYTYQRTLHSLQALSLAPRGLRSTLFRAAENTFGCTSYRLKKILEILQFKNDAELFQYFVGTIGPLRMDRLAKLLVDSEKAAHTPDAFEPLMQDLEELDWDEKILQVFIRTFLADTVLAKTDRAGMAYGLEARVPFLDDEMTALAACLPQDLKVRHGASKYLLRKLLEKKLPGKLSARKKQGFSIPLRDWFRTDLKYLLDEYLRPARLKREGYFDPSEVQLRVREHLSGKFNHSHLLWSLVCFQMWHERYLE